MNSMLLDMYVMAVKTGRLDIELVPSMYRSKVAEVLGIEIA